MLLVVMVVAVAVMMLRRAAALATTRVRILVVMVMRHNFLLLGLNEGHSPFLDKVSHNKKYKSMIVVVTVFRFEVLFIFDLESHMVNAVSHFNNLMGLVENSLGVFCDDMGAEC